MSHSPTPPTIPPPKNKRDVRVDAKLNKYIWSKGIRNVPYRVRVKLSRKRNEDEEAAEGVRCSYVWTCISYVLYVLTGGGGKGMIGWMA